MEPPRRPVFVTTHWSVVLTAGRSDTTRARAALEQLCRHYWQPLYAYVRRVGHPPEEAQDLTQEFFARLLEHNTIARADPARGRFRSFLLASLKNFLAHEWEKARAQKRGGRVQVIPLEFDTAETRCAPELANTDTPDKIFDRQWALSLLDVVLARLRADYADCGQGRPVPRSQGNAHGRAFRDSVSGVGRAAGHERGRGEDGGAPVAATLPRTAARGDRQHRGRPRGSRGGTAASVRRARGLTRPGCNLGRPFR